MTIQNGIAIALAVLVVGTFFIYPRFFPFATATATTNPTTDTSAAAGAADNGIGDNSAPMPTPATGDVSSLQIIDEKVGTGTTVVAGDQITVNYVGMLADGKVFDASANHGGPATFAIGVGQVIPGWDQGVVGMKEGGKRKLVIPASLAYGANGVPGVIPGGATLTFEVEVVKVTHAK